MYTLLNKFGVKAWLIYEMPSLVLSWIIAEVFYKFDSFTLETSAFLATWWLAGCISCKLIRKK